MKNDERGSMKLLKFYSKTCGPCRLLSKIIESLKVEDLEVVSIDIAENNSIVEEYSVRSVPTLVFLNNEGKEFHRETRPIPKEKLEQIISQKG